MLEIADLRFAHHGREPVADGIDLAIPSGQLHALQGPSGCGKSTLLRIAAGLIPRVQGGRIAGQARLDGQPVHRIPPAKLPARLGWVPQDPEESFAARTVERELGQLARNLGRDSPSQAAREGLSKLAADHLLDRSVHELSGGEAARVSLAAAGLGHPAALVLDEPATQLDARGRKRVAGWIDEQRDRGASLLLAAHPPHTFAGIADEVHPLAEHATRPRPKPLPRAPGGEVLASLEAATRCFEDGPTIGPVDLELTAGEVVGLTGPNGAGKTTILHLLAGLHEPDRGQVRVAGAPPGELDPRSLASRLGIAFQHPAWHITQDTVAEEVGFTSGQLGDPIRPRAFLDRLGLAGYAGVHPWDLSGGERQRLAVASAAAHEPDVLLLDEPTRGLDPASFSRLVDLLRERSRAGKATLVATHHEPLIDVAHRTVRLGGSS